MTVHPRAPYQHPNNNAMRVGWEAFFEGRARAACPFPRARDDLLRGYEQGWDEAQEWQAEENAEDIGDVEVHSPSPGEPGYRAPDQDARISELSAENVRLREALAKIVDESVFNQQRFAEDDDTDYFLRCFRAVKDSARAALTPLPGVGGEKP